MKFLLIVTIIFTFISNLNAEKILVESSYCQQFRKLDIQLDTSTLKELSDHQYINEDFQNFSPVNKLDYYIRYLHISKGLCYYTNNEDIKELSKVGQVEFNSDETDEHFLGDLRYEKTVNCYYMYHKYMVPGQNVTLNPPCPRIYATFFNAMLYFLKNETLCPYPQDDNRVSLGTKEDIIKARNEYIVELFDLYKKEIEGKDYVCEDNLNNEIFNCGYGTTLQKNSYCNQFRYTINEDSECCRYKSYIVKIVEINYDVPWVAKLSGVGTSLILICIGLYFSYFYTKEIKNQESIKKAIAAQEKIYQENSRQQMLDANANAQSLNYSDGYNSITYSTNNSNSHQILPPNQHHSLPNSVNATSPQIRAIRSPQPLPASPADISNIRPNMNNASLLVNDRPTSIISSSSPNISPLCTSLPNRPTSVASTSSSLSVNPRLSSLPNQHTSKDVNGRLSIPVNASTASVSASSPDGPKSLNSKSVSPRPRTPILSTPPSPRPAGTASLRPMAPHSPRQTSSVSPRLLDAGSVSPRTSSISPRLMAPTSPISTASVSPKLRTPASPKLVAPASPRSMPSESPRIVATSASPSEHPLPQRPLTPGTPSIPTTPSSMLPPLALTLPSELDVPYIVDSIIDTSKSKINNDNDNSNNNDIDNDNNTNTMNSK